MAITREYGNPANDPGEWVEYGTDQDTGKVVKLKLRDIPATVEQRLRVTHGMDRLSSKNGVLVIDTERSRVHARARAAYALMESENYEHLLGDAEAAKAYQQMVGTAATELAAGTPLLMDGKWTDQVRAHYLAEHAEVVTFVTEWVDERRGRGRKKEEALAGN